MALLTDLLHDNIMEGSWRNGLLLAGAILYLFTCLYTVSDRHLTVSLRNIANSLSLPTDLAGMTLLAFGNGAPDFFTAIFGASQAPDMILSGAVGAALFTFTIVYGLVIIWQQPEVVQRVPVQSEEPESQSQVPSLSLLVHPSTIDRVPFFRNLLLCLFCICCLLTLLRIRVIYFWMPLILLCVYLTNLSASIIMHIVRQRHQAVPVGTSLTEKGVPLEGHVFWSNSTMEKICFLLIHSTKTTHQGGLHKLVHFVGLFIRLPITVVSTFTLLPVRYTESGDIKEDELLFLLITNRVRLLTSPLGTLALFGLLLNIRSPVIWLALIITALLSSTVLWIKCSSWTKSPADSILLVQSLITFTTCLGFIYLISGELITYLREFGHLMGVSLSTMGVLVLAWGNSFGDLVVDTRMSRSGFLNMAMFGVFAAHIQNVLFTLGTSFLLATIANGGSITVEAIDLKVFIGVGIVLFVLLTSLILIPTFFKFLLPKSYGYTLLSLYGIFAIIAMFIEVRSGRRGG